MNVLDGFIVARDRTFVKINLTELRQLPAFPSTAGYFSRNLDLLPQIRREISLVHQIPIRIETARIELTPPGSIPSDDLLA